MMRSGYSGIVIGALLLIGITLPGVVVGWLNTRHEATMENLKQDVRRLRVEERSAGAGSRRTLAKVRVEGLQKQLEGRDRLSARLEQLHRIAGGYGVRIGKAGYQLHPADLAAGGVGRYDIRLEADATYYELRFFLRDLLAADSLLALEAIELRRAAAGGYNAGGKSILATLHIVMYFGTAE
jgi:hypothetical protein